LRIIRDIFNLIALREISSEKRKTIIRITRVLVGLSISIIILGIIYKSIDIKEVVHAIKEIHFVWLPLAIIVYIIGIWIRTARWVLLMDPIKKCSTRTLFPVYIISYMVNNVLPLRMGDVYRAYFTGKKESISKGATLVTVGVERIFDGLTMLFLLAASFWFFPVSEPVVKKAIQIGSIIFLGAIVVCYTIVLKKYWSNWVFRKALLIVPNRYHIHLEEI